jgi:hypothetical protein
MLTQQSKITKINNLHNLICGTMKKTVAQAVKIGGLLTEIKSTLEPGEIGEWIKANCNFNWNTANKYISCYLYDDKLTSAVNLQEAYKLIDTFESQKKQEEWKIKDGLIKQKMETGVNPEGWDRACDYEYKKRTDEYAFQERVKKAFENKTPETPKYEKVDDRIDRLTKMADEFVENALKNTRAKEEFKSKIKMSGDNADNVFFEFIDTYLIDMDDDNVRLEACHNIIKYCKGIASKLQINSIQKGG